MAMTNKLSEVVKTFIDKELGKFPVIEIEFKFMRYRLTIDNIEVAEKIKELMQEAIDAQVKPEKKEVTLPKFYKDYESKSEKP